MSFQQWNIQPSSLISSAPIHPSFASTVTPVHPQYHHAFQHQAYHDGLPSSPRISPQAIHPPNLLPPASGSYVPYLHATSTIRERHDNGQ